MKSSPAEPGATADIGVFILPRESPARKAYRKLTNRAHVHPLHAYIEMGKFMKE
jgi:hypothetical protein